MEKDIVLMVVINTILLAPQLGFLLCLYRETRKKKNGPLIKMIGLYALIHMGVIIVSAILSSVISAYSRTNTSDSIREVYKLYGIIRQVALQPLMFIGVLLLLIGIYLEVKSPSLPQEEVDYD